MKRNCDYKPCGKEYEAKREASKFCSTSCRVMFSRANKGNQKKEAEKSLLLQTNVLLNSVLDAVGKINYGVVPTILDAPRNNNLVHDEPLSFQKMKQEAVFNQSLPSFQDLLNGMSNLAFADDKEDYAEKIKDASHLSEKQRNLLLTSLWAKR